MMNLRNSKQSNRRRNRSSLYPEESSLRSFGRIVLPFLTYYLLNLVVSILFMIGVRLYLSASGTYSLELWQQTLSGLGYEMTLLMAIAAIPIMLRWYKKDRARRAAAGAIETPTEEQIETRKKKQPLQLLLCALMGISACFLVNHLMMLTGMTTAHAQDVESVSKILYQGRLILELAGTAVIIPVAEELVYRALTMGRIQDYLRTPLAIGTSAIIFGAMHGNLLQGLFAFALGLLLGWSYSRCRSLAAPMILHMGANLISVLVSETQVFGFVYRSNSAFLVVTVGSGILLLLCLVALVKCTKE